MKLSDSDRHSLAQMVSAFKIDDPTFAKLMEGPAGSRAARSADPRYPARAGQRAVAFWVLIGLVAVAVGMLGVGVVLMQPVAIVVAGGLLLADLTCLVIYRLVHRAKAT